MLLPPADSLDVAQRNAFLNFKMSLGGNKDDQVDEDEDDDDEWWEDEEVEEGEEGDMFARDEEAEMAAPSRQSVSSREQRDSEMQIKRQMLENDNWVTGGEPRPSSFVTVDESSEEHFDYLQCAPQCPSI